MSFFGSIARLLTRDLMGKTWERESDHPYFGRILYFGSNDPDRCYWEAELQLPGEKRIGVTMAGTPQGPTPAEQEFCTQALGDLDRLFHMCRVAFEPEYAKLAKMPMPADWRIKFRLDGFQIPVDGNSANSWEVCYFVEAVGHYFTAFFENGSVQHVLEWTSASWPRYAACIFSAPRGQLAAAPQLQR
jgi:hypothetical protein